MVSCAYCCFLLVLCVSTLTVEAFVTHKLVESRELVLNASKLPSNLSAFHDDIVDTDVTPTLSRRSLLVSLSTLSVPLLFSQPSLADDEAPTRNIKEKILVLGGTGFVGSQVVAKLQELGIETIATSRNGRDGTIALDFTASSDIKATVKRLASTQEITSIISCIGAIGTANDETINAGTGLAAQGAKEAGSVQRFVYITVAPEVKEFARNVDFLQGYMAGKTTSREQALQAFGNDAILIEPTFIYGGGSFELNPPRVASFYGQFIEGILSSSPIRNVERLLSPGFIKIALEPPVPVEDVANAAIAGALGKTEQVMDSYDKIKRASALLQEQLS